jgi:hypothetical protein
MNSILTEQLRQDFFIRLYFDTSNGYEIAGIKRAFLDFSRTLKVKDNRAILKKNAENYLLTEMKSITEREFTSQQSFDNFHKQKCEQLIIVWTELSIGQAQKWINMTLKYWLLFGDNRINGIELNAKYFHIPIDSYVQKGMFNEKSPNAWSKIKDYENYMDYQNKHRVKQTGNYPLIDEFNFFNSYNPK